MSSITAYIPNHAIYTIAGVLAAHFPKCTPERVEKMIQQEFEKDTYLRLFDDEEQQKPQIEQPKQKQSDEIEQTLPDYSIYPEFTSALGFLTRGCIRNCPWCIVPKKEGTLKVVDDIARIAQNRKNVILLDNNFLASPEEFVKEQLEKASALGLRIDFNQALDCRLVNEQNAPLLAKTKWIQYIRFSCDTSSCLPHIEHAVRLIRKFGYNGHFFVYALAKEFDEAHERILKLLDIDDRIDPFCQPYIDYSGGTADKKLKKLARWCNRPALRKTTTWNDYKWQ